MAAFDLFKRLVGGGERRQSEPRLRAAVTTRVLVVDDSATIRAVMGKMLAQDGYEVLKAADGESALALARGEHVDLIFLDIVMPGISGFEVLRTLRREPDTHAIPIVMMSGNVQATEQFYVQRYGADDFMKKPFGREEVFERVRQLVQAGRLQPRNGAASAAPPAGVSQAEWDAIPDVGLPDPAHQIAHPPVAGHVEQPAPAAAPVQAHGLLASLQTHLHLHPHAHPVAEPVAPGTPASAPPAPVAPVGVPPALHVVTPAPQVPTPPPHSTDGSARTG